MINSPWPGKCVCPHLPVHFRDLAAHFRVPAERPTALRRHGPNLPPRRPGSHRGDLGAATLLTARVRRYFYQLSERIGKENLNAALRQFLEENRFQGLPHRAGSAGLPETRYPEFAPVSRPGLVRNNWTRGGEVEHATEHFLEHPRHSRFKKPGMSILPS
jgi:hypothetical protein